MIQTANFNQEMEMMRGLTRYERHQASNEQRSKDQQEPIDEGTKNSTSSRDYIHDVPVVIEEID